jgi:hypothetical protein
MKVTDLGFIFPTSFTLNVEEDNGYVHDVEVNIGNGKTEIVFEHSDEQKKQEVIELVEKMLDSGEIKYPTFLSFEWGTEKFFDSDWS